MISQIAALIVNVVAETPVSDQGDTDDIPIAVPSVRSSVDTAAAANAPPNTADHETAENSDSLFDPLSAV